MGDLASLKQKMEERLKEAEAKVEMLRESLRMINEEMGAASKRPAVPRTPKPPSDSLIALSPKTGSDSLPQKIKSFILGIEGEFNNRGVTLAVLKSFPNLPGDLDEKAMLNRVTNIVWRLRKAGMIEVTHQGVGNEPNTFRVLRPTKKAGEDTVVEEKDQL